MYKLQVKQFIQAAHQLPKSEDLVTKECSRLHGHTYLIKVDFWSKDNERNGMVVDFKGIKNIINLFDHQFLNEVFEDTCRHWKMSVWPTTAENFAKMLCFIIEESYPDLRDVTVSVCEGYKGEDQSSWAIFKTPV